LHFREINIMNDASKSPAEQAPHVEGATLVDGSHAEAALLGQAPLKVVTGSQTTNSLSFVLQPGAIVAHPGSRVIFVCG
jgi:hypothetical protein